MIDIQKVRSDFPIIGSEVRGKKLVYLDSGATSQKSRQVIEAIRKYYEKTNANIHRGVYDLSVESTRLVDESRAKAAAFIGARDAREVIFVRNTTEGINLVMNSYGRENVSEGDAVVVTKLEHHSNFVPWQILCKEKGAEFRVAEVDSEGRLVMGSLEELLDEKVKVVAITGQSNALGTLVDLEVVVKTVRKRAPNAVILVDGAQVVPHMKIDVTKLGIDFLTFSGHKMLGPTGIGVLWGKKELLQKMKPFLYGGDMISEVRIEETTFAEIPSRFEAGTPDIAGIVGLGAAVDYLSELGMDIVREHEKEITEYAMKKFVELEKEGLVELYGPKNASEKGGVVAFNLKGVHAHDTAQVLNEYGISVRSGQHCAAPLVTSFGVSAMVRATFYVYTTKEEIDFLIDKIREVPKVFI